MSDKHVLFAVRFKMPSPHAFTVLVRLADWADEDGTVRCSQGDLQAGTGFCAGTIRKALRYLISCGMVEDLGPPPKPGRGYVSRMRICMPADEATA